LQTAVNKELDNVMQSEAAIWTAMVTQQAPKRKMNQAIESGCVVTGQQHNSGASVNEV